MAQENERINHPISTAELERRWAAVRAAMAEHRIDALLMQSNNDWMGGYVKYFTDVPATNGYPVTVVFPKDERMTVIAQGPMGVVREFPPPGDSVRRGTARFMGMPSYASCPYTAEYDAQLAEHAFQMRRVPEQTPLVTTLSKRKPSRDARRHSVCMNSGYRNGSPPVKPRISTP